MKLINNMTTIPLYDEKWLLVNTLNGLADEIDKDVFGILQKWMGHAQIQPDEGKEALLFRDLLKRGYLVSDDAEERKLKEAILIKLREAHKKAKENPETITFVLTYNCNFRCDYCFEASNPPSTDIITSEMADVALSLTKESLKYIGFFGGEPLLRKQYRWL